ncbi:metal-dependent hydrolase of the beta-lactamase superfamily protein [Lactobacillus selangorensis]|uniref:Metal-dependent hydrolase of the beta-lactamase superfamily protein n=1 Tax=Lactobacillus selangorensis TaxID=81857 RepID=A0A0R2G6X4_9LACO|nr:MBL fold metallo-hydrolase [Lactobacillus selangorensis]KRN28666.1 metal-dependent hydrolase of the beta-lactamase superfamily protein [Lactobacillus selangorensis]KRN32924.1 metal-dependent hydrolase of the beta-lactamase superfamily protein [Lactobacillus selangorensis]
MSDDFGMRVSVLASSSSGNSTYIETPEHKVLVDAGLSGKKIKEAMASIGRDIKDVDSLFVTHEHTDHSHGVGVLARRYGLQVYANKKTWQAMAHTVGKIPDDQIHFFEANKTKSFGDLDVESFSVSHDAADPQFYEFHHDDKAFVVLTDTGYVSDRMAGQIRDAEAYLFECNHDTEMLRMGEYPWPLKQRILSDQGHLSNEEGANALMDVMGLRTKKIYLGHLSQHNNMKELAHLTVASMMKEQGLGVDHDFKILDTDPAVADPLFTV